MKRRRVIQLVLLLIAGAIVNVAVAWGDCIYDIGARSVPLLSGMPLVGDIFHRPWNYGFICESLQIDDAHPRYTFVSQERITWNGGLRVDGPRWLIGEDPIRLPIRILWPGFAINTIFYAAILWVVFLVPGKLRGTLLRRRGLCSACAYPVGTSSVCTECGAARVE